MTVRDIMQHDAPTILWSCSSKPCEIQDLTMLCTYQWGGGGGRADPGDFDIFMEA